MNKDKLSVEVKLKKITLNLSKDAIVVDLDLKGFIGEKQVYHEKQIIKVWKVRIGDNNGYSNYKNG